jgi:hypothetical protein
MNRPGMRFQTTLCGLWKRWPWALGLAVAMLALAGPLSGSDVNREGAAPYTPTQGEWLCLMLNTQEALFASEQQPDSVAVRYVYDRSQPNKLGIAILYGAHVNALEVQRQVRASQQRAMELAKLHGWDGWLKLELTRTALNGPPTPQILSH